MTEPTPLFGVPGLDRRIQDLRNDALRFKPYQVDALVAVEKAALDGIEKDLNASTPKERQSIVTDMLSNIQVIANWFATPTSHDARFRACLEVGYTTLKLAEHMKGNTEGDVRISLLADFHTAVSLVSSHLALAYQQNEVAIRSAVSGIVLAEVLIGLPSLTSKPLGNADIEYLCTPFWNAMHQRADS